MKILSNHFNALLNALGLKNEPLPDLFPMSSGPGFLFFRSQSKNYTLRTLEEVDAYLRIVLLKNAAKITPENHLYRARMFLLANGFAFDLKLDKEALFVSEQEALFVEVGDGKRFVFGVSRKTVLHLHSWSSQGMTLAETLQYCKPDIEKWAHHNFDLPDVENHFFYKEGDYTMAKPACFAPVKST